MPEVLSSENGVLKVKLEAPDKGLRVFLVARSSESEQKILVPDEHGVISVPFICPNGGRTSIFEETVNPVTGKLIVGEEVFADTLTAPVVKKPLLAPVVVAGE